jgi:hypothetical protein
VSAMVTGGPWNHTKDGLMCTRLAFVASVFTVLALVVGIAPSLRSNTSDGPAVPHVLANNAGPASATP